MIGVMTEKLSKAIARRLKWADITFSPPQFNWELFPSPNEHSVPDVHNIIGFTPHFRQAEPPWWEYMRGYTSAKPAWWDDPDPLVSCSYVISPFSGKLIMGFRNGFTKFVFPDTSLGNI